jgi:Mn-dependent DtxR family transcriptional regulator
MAAWLTYIARDYAYRAMRSYEQAVFDVIKNKGRVNRKEILHEFQHLAQKTVYGNVNKLERAGRIKIDQFGYISLTDKELNGGKDDWPIHPILESYMNTTAMTNAFAWQDDEFIEDAKALSRKYGHQMTLLLNDLSVLYAIMQGVDTWKAYESKSPIDRDELKHDFEQLSNLLEHYNTLAVKR